MAPKAKDVGNLKCLDFKGSRHHRIMLGLQMPKSTQYSEYNALFAPN